MSDHSFNPFIAQKYGVIEAIIINSFIFWTRTNAAKEENFHDGRYWFFGTPEYFSKYFPYLSTSQIKYAFKKLFKSNAILKGKFNKKGYDQTNWYSLSDSLLSELNLDKTCLQAAKTLIEQNCPMHGTKLSNARDKIVQPIPVTKQATKQDTNTPLIPLKGGVWRFDEFWQIYPVKKSKDTCRKKWITLNLDGIADEIFSSLSAQILNDRAWIDGFIPNPLTYLNQKRWEDELDLRPRSSNGKQQSTNDFHNTMAKYKPKLNQGTYDEHGNFTENYL